MTMLHTTKLIATNGSRRAFTLVELLIVIAIMALLMSLTFSVMYGLTTQAEEVATTTTIRKIDALLQQRIEAFNRAFKGARAQAAADFVRVDLVKGKIFGVRDEVVDILAKKRLFRFEFPQRMSERLEEEHPKDLDGQRRPTPKVSDMADSVFVAVAAPNAREQLISEGNPTPTDQQILQRATANWQKHQTAMNSRTDTTESAEMLYFALTAAASYGVATVDSDRFTDEEVADTDEDGLPEFVDAWGQPLRFYRWPTRLIDMNLYSPFQPDVTNPSDPTDTRGVGTQEREIIGLLLRGLSPPPVTMPNGATPRDVLLIDPDDPVGRLYSELERLNGMDGKPAFRVEFNEERYHTPDTYHTPLIVSPGADGKLGLLEPTPTLQEMKNNLFGNLASVPDVDRNNVINLNDLKAVRDILTDNITNRNRPAGARR